jgi:hypothetical protein
VFLRQLRGEFAAASLMRVRDHDIEAVSGELTRDRRPYACASGGGDDRHPVLVHRLFLLCHC